MLASGDWWAPRYNDRPFFDKPVPFHQLQALAMRTFSDREFAIRIVPATAGLALVFTTFGSARRCGRLRWGWPGRSPSGEPGAVRSRALRFGQDDVTG